MESVLDQIWRGNNPRLNGSHGKNKMIALIQGLLSACLNSDRVLSYFASLPPNCYLGAKSYDYLSVCIQAYVNDAINDVGISTSSNSGGSNWDSKKKTTEGTTTIDLYE